MVTPVVWHQRLSVFNSQCSSAVSLSEQRWSRPRFCFWTDSMEQGSTSFSTPLKSADVRASSYGQVGTGPVKIRELISSRFAGLHRSRSRTAFHARRWLSRRVPAGCPGRPVEGRTRPGKTRPRRRVLMPGDWRRILLPCWRQGTPGWIAAPASSIVAAGPWPSVRES
jgi:hypothetical protein